MIRLYFDRWPLQENVFRDGKGRVGLQRNYGFGKEKVTDVAIVDKLDKLTVRERRLQTQQRDQELQVAEAVEQVEQWTHIVHRAHQHHRARDERLTHAIAHHNPKINQIQEEHELTQVYAEYLPDAKVQLEQAKKHQEKVRARLTKTHTALERVTQRQEKLARRRKVFTNDTELDEIMVGYKLTFMNLCLYLMRHVLGVQMEIDTLIRRVLTLPGEREFSRGKEVIRIYRQARDPVVTTMLERACAQLNQKERRRGKFLLVFEVVDPPST